MTHAKRMWGAAAVVARLYLPFCRTAHALGHSPHPVGNRADAQPLYQWPSAVPYSTADPRLSPCRIGLIGHAEFARRDRRALAADLVHRCTEMRPATEARSMAVTQERTPTPREPVCAICHMPIRAEQDRVTVQEEHYHARCYERREARRPRARAAARARRFTPSAGLSFGWAPTTLDQERRAHEPFWQHPRKTRLEGQD